MLFSPEHGIRGTEDRMNILDSKDAATGLPVISLYGENTLPPPDSALDKLDALVIDLQDIGARPWTYVATMVYAVRAAGQHRIPVLVLDRPNPIGGEIVEGPVLDSSLAYAGSQSDGAMGAADGALSDPAAARDDDGRTRQVLQRGVGAPGGPPRDPDAELAPLALVRSHRAPLGESLAEHDVAHLGVALPRDRVAGVGERLGGPRHLRPLPVGGRAVDGREEGDRLSSTTARIRA